MKNVQSVYNEDFLDQFFKWVQFAPGNGHDITDLLMNNKIFI